MEEEIQLPKRRGMEGKKIQIPNCRIAWFMHRKHILLWATMGIAFVIFLTLFSQSLINDSEISKDIKLNTQLVQNLRNNELMAREDSAASMLEDVKKLERENSKIAVTLTQITKQLHNFSAALVMNRSLSPSALETLAQLKRENARIAEDVMQMLDVVRNFTDVFCTTCPAHWLHFQKSCYFFSSASSSWETAKQACESEGAHLVIVNHWIEQNFMIKQMVNEQVFWIGLSDAAIEGQWTWLDGTPLSLSFWGKDEPNNAGSGEDCATLRFNGKWNDATCSGNEHWICEKKC